MWDRISTPLWELHWPFQEPKLEVPTIYISFFFQAYARADFQEIYPQGIASYGTVPPVQVPEMAIDYLDALELGVWNVWLRVYDTNGYYPRFLGCTPTELKDLDPT